MKIAINRCWGGFSLSKEAYDYLGIEWDDYGYKYSEESKRCDPALIECIETLGEIANGSLSSIKIVEIPDDVEWEISNYDGIECVEEKHRMWC